MATSGFDAHDSAGVAANAAGLKASGYQFAGQYIDQDAANADGGAGVTAAQVQQDNAAGLEILSIFETNSMASTNFQTGAPQYTWETYLTRAQGMTDAQQAVASAQAIGQPVGSTIYFAMDFDPAATNSATFTEADALQAADNYFQGINDYLAAHGSPYKVGVYGAGDTLNSVVRQNNLASSGWLTQSTGWAGSGAGNPNAQGWNITQQDQTTSNGVAIDPDNANGDVGTWTTACFASGTRIRTARGEVPVEALVVGDKVVTASGAWRPIRWLGHRAIACGSHPRPADVMPVRVAAEAFGTGLPARDLYLSPGHPVLVGADADAEGGHLVPVMCLVNGTTVARVRADQVTYWHVELDAHDILLAEGLPAESYLDWGNRPFFADGDDHALTNPDFVVPGLAGRCRPVALDGPVVEAERCRLDGVFASRLAAACAWPEAMADDGIR